MPHKDRAAAAAYQRAWVERNKEQHFALVTANKKRYIERNQEIAREAKRKPCMDCGNRYPTCAMQFDHVHGKTANVSRLVALPASVARLEAEIARCEIVCANCHFIRTHTRAGWPVD